jgi:phosphoserine aminotransferase
MKMPRINPTVTDKAASIYESLDHHVRGRFVSEAIEEKAARAQFNGPFTQEQEQRIREIIKGILKVDGGI